MSILDELTSATGDKQSNQELIRSCLQQELAPRRTTLPPQLNQKISNHIAKLEKTLSKKPLHK